jgi:hypothetical protein
VERERPKSLKAIADLARAGVGRYGSARSAVQFRVHHLADLPGAYRNVLAAEEKHQFVETLTSAAHGAALIIETYVERDAVELRTRLDGELGAEVVKDPHGDRKVFTGVAQPNPSFLFEGTTVLECLVSVAPQVPLSRGYRRHDGVSVYRLMGEIARLAADVAESPILSLQAPALVPAPPGGTPTSDYETWPRSSAMAVRFSIATGELPAERRFAYVQTLEAYCRERGLGLWVSDQRPSHRAGNWFQILEHDAGRATKTAEGVVGADDALERVLPLTLVGPARIGSTLATLNLFGPREPAVLASSITVLDDLAFIHLQIGLTPDDPTALLDDHSDTGPHPVPTLDRLGRILSAYGIQTHAYPLPDVLAGYTPLHGPVIEIEQSPPAARPIWLAWEVDSAQGGLRDMILGLSEALDQLVDSVGPESTDGAGPRGRAHYPNIEYLISRDLGVGSVRAKGKLQVPDALLERLPLPGAAGQPASWGGRGVAVARSLEDSWLTLLRNVGVAPRELRVAWRERWLGR